MVSVYMVNFEKGFDQMSYILILISLVFATYPSPRPDEYIFTSQHPTHKPLFVPMCRK